MTFVSSNKKEPKNSQLAFTLVEILVVIAVIGLLSSIIFAITQGANEQGRIAKGLYFSQHLHNSLGSYVAGIWNFDEGSDTTANDTSGWENDGTLVNSPTWRCASTDISYTPSGQGCSLEFNGSSNYVNIGDILDIGVNDLTIETWIKPLTISPAGNQYVVSKSNSSTTDGRYAVGMSTDGKARVVFDPGSGLAFNGNISLTTSWNHIAAVYDRDDDLSVYVNGAYDVGESISAGNGINYDTSIPLIIGGYTSTSGFFDGLIDEIRIYEAALTSAQVQSQYYAGLKNLLAKSQLTEQEYLHHLAER
jgi:prepilin-type N-terminal cleavage/methylation domain-containing protein